MPEQILYQPGIDNSRLSAGLSQMEAMVDARVKAIQARMAASGKGAGMFTAFTGASPAMSALESQITRTSKATAGLGRSLDRVGGVLTGGMGIGIAVGGLLLLEQSFSKAINKAREFQTAQLAIAASISSAYKLQGPAGAVSGGASFTRALGEAQRFNKQIIERQAKNILTYEEQLGAFQSSVNAGARKGLMPQQTLEVSEQLAIVAKTLGLRGEEIANASRIALGGATNISRSTIGRALGISNEDIQKRQGPDLQKFLMDKTRGFKQAEPSFAKSIEGVLSTLEAKIDVFAAGIGTKFMDKATPLIEQFGKAFDGADADKFAQTLTDLFGGLLKAVETLAKSPAIPMILKFLEFLATFGDKILIIGALIKMASILGSVGAGFKNFIGLLQGVASEAANAAGSVDRLAAAETRAAMAAGGAGAAGMGSRGALAAGAAGGGAGFVPLGQMSRGGRQALFEQAQQGAGVFGMQAPGTGGISNLKQYRGQYEAAKAAHSADISNRMRGLQNKNLQAASRAASEASFNRFQTQQAYPINTTGIGAGIAKGEAAEAANASAMRKARIGQAGVVGMDAAMRFASGAALGFFASQLVKNKTDESTNATTRGLGSALQGGATVGGGLAMSGALFNPLGIAVTALTAAFAGLQGALGAFDDELRTSQNALAAFDKEHPLAAQIRDLKGQRSDLGKSTITTANTNPGLTNFFAGKYGGDTKQANLLTSRTVKGRQEALTVQIEEAQDAMRAQWVNDETQRVAEGRVKDLQGVQRILSLGYGGKNAVSQIENQAELNKGEIDMAAAKGEIPVTDEIKAQAARMFAQYETARAKFKAKRTADRRAGRQTETMPNYLSRYATQEDVEQDLGKADLMGQNKQRADDQKAVREFTKKSLMGGLDPNRIAGAHAKGRADLEKDIIGKRGEFEDIGEYEKFATMARKKFEHDFNEPLKRLEAQLQGLSLGVGSENVIEAADLAYKITDKKLQELVDAFDITAAQADKLRLQAGAERQAKIAGGQFEQRHQAFGKTGVGRILGRERSQETVAFRGYQADREAARGDPVREAYFKKLGEIESKRGGILDPAQFEEFKRTSLDTFRKQMALQALGGGGLTTQEQLSRGMRDADLSMRGLQNDLRQSTQNRAFELGNRPLEDTSRMLQATQEDRSMARLREDRGNAQAEARIGATQAGLGVRGAELDVRKAAIAPALDQGGGPFGTAAAAIQYKVQAEQGFDAKSYEAALRESIRIKKEEAIIAQQASKLTLEAARITYDRAQKAGVQGEQDYQAALQNYALKLQERSASEAQLVAQRAQSDQNYILAQEKLRNQIADMAVSMETAKKLLVGSVGTGKNPVSGQIMGNLSAVKTLNLTLSPTITSNVRVDASAIAFKVPDSEIDKIAAKAGEKIKQDLKRACQRS